MIIEAQHYGIHPEDLDFIVEALRRGKIGIVPTDSIFAFCCLADQKAGYEAICRIKHIEPQDAMMSIVCRDLSQASEYFTQWDTPTYRVLNKNLPGPFTFILNSGNKAPAFLKNKRKTLGLRIPMHPAIQSIMDRVDMPLMVSSVMQDDDVTDFFTDADQLITRFEKQVGFIVLEEHAIQAASTVVDMTGTEPVIIRQSVAELKQ